MDIIPVPAFRDNYIWLAHDGRHALVVDPGDAAPVLDTLGRLGLQHIHNLAVVIKDSNVPARLVRGSGQVCVQAVRQAAAIEVVDQFDLEEFALHS